MTSSAQKKKQRLKRFDPRAWIGFLIGYSSSNIYRVWIPAQNKVISTRDVIFNEDEFFDGNVQSLKDDLLHISMEELAELVKKTALPEQEEEDLPETTIEDETHLVKSIARIRLVQLCILVHPQTIVIRRISESANHRMIASKSLL